LFFQINSDWFNVAPFNEFLAQEGLANRQTQIAANNAKTDIGDNRLPIGIVFANGITVADGRSADAFDRGGQGGGSRIQPILFYPDGTTQDAQVFLMDQKQNLTSVQLRGLTGIAKTVTVSQ
jgi:hypothetical protein